MKIIRLIGFLAVCAAMFGGWWLYDRGQSVYDLFHRHIQPVTIADTATSYSLGQLIQAGKAKSDGPAVFGHDFSSDVDFVPEPITYIRVTYLGTVEKPFPTIYIADGNFPPSVMGFESVRVVEPDAMLQVLARASNLPCSPNSADEYAGRISDYLEVLLRTRKHKLARCLVSHATGCSFLDAIHRQTDDRIVGDRAASLSEMEQLRSRMKCPKFPVLSWK